MESSEVESPLQAHEATDCWVPAFLPRLHYPAEVPQATLRYCETAGTLPDDHRQEAGEFFTNFLCFAALRIKLCVLFAGEASEDREDEEGGG